MEFINTNKAPMPVGSYSQAVKVGNLLFLSGQLPINPEDGQMCSGGVAEQTLRVMKNLEAVLQHQGLDKTALVKTTILLTNLADFAEFNRVYGEFLGSHRPARAAFEVADLFKGALVEIEAIATLN